QHFEVTVDRPGAVQRCEFLLQIRFEVSNLLSGEIFNLDVSESRLNVQIIFVRPAADRFLLEPLILDVVFEYFVKRYIIRKQVLYGSQKFSLGLYCIAALLESSPHGLFASPVNVLITHLEIPGLAPL